MRKLFTMVLALALVAALAVSALADVDIRYVDRDEVKVYAEQDKESQVLKKFKGGKKLLIEEESEDKEWVGVLIEDPNGGQRMGWIMAKYLSLMMPREYCEHEWSPWEVTTQATCSQTGSRVRSCAICGARDMQDIARLAHSYGSWQTTRQATCAKPGERVRTCAVCGHQDKEEVTVAHTYPDWTILKQPTCSELGAKTRKCQVCGHEDTRTIDKLPHTYSWQILMAATDHSAGLRTQICSVCGHTEPEVSYDPEGTMRRKDKGENVYYMQQLLVDQGYLNVGGADGIFGGGTEKAVMQFQKDQGLSPDGVVWPQTLKRLQHDFGPWQTLRPMTRSESGIRVRVCKDCGYEQKETVSAGTTFEFKRRGEDIRALQQILGQLGYDAGKYDGIYGNKLDAAFTAFAQANGYTYEAGAVYPSDVDALMNAWFTATPAESWKGEGTVDSPVNLALTVTPGSDENADPDITTYGFSLTNLGSESCQFNALLLTYGSDPDFTHDNLVMVIDGAELKANCGNSVSGSFSVASTWGEGSLNFAAMALTDATGDKWLSNTVTFEAPTSAKTVAPGENDIDVENLPDGTYPVAFQNGDVLQGASGVFIMAARIFTLDTYDIVDVHTLAEGDTFLMRNEEIPVTSVEFDEDGYVLINGGYDFENDTGVTLAPVEESNCYRVVMEDDIGTYTDHGVTTLTLDPSAVFVNASDLEAGEVTVAYDDLAAAIQALELDFNPVSASVRIENGKVVEIRLDYQP